MEQDVRGGPASTRGRGSGLLGGLLGGARQRHALPTRRQAARDGVSQERRKNMGEMAGEARFSREMAAARGLIGDPAQARRDSPDPGRRHDGRGHLAAIFWRRAGRAAAEKSRACASDSIDAQIVPDCSSQA